MFSQAAIIGRGVGGREGGFTLIELLVVIAIIALLMSILMPALGMAREQAQAVVCMTNLRNIGMAVSSYANNYRGYLVPARYRPDADPASGARIRSRNMWSTILLNEGELTAPKSDRRDVIASGPSSLRCPSGIAEPAMTDPGGWLAGGLDTNWSESEIRDAQRHHAGAEGRPNECDDDDQNYWVHNWYGVNGETWAVWDTPFTQIPNDGNERTLHRLDEFPRVSSIAGMFDGFWLVDVFPGRINARHLRNSRSNIMMLDGHVDSFDIDELPRENWRAGGSAVDVDERYPIWRLRHLR